MANHAYVTIKLNGPQEQIKELMERVQYGPEEKSDIDPVVGIGTIDFNKVIPVPEELERVGMIEYEHSPALYINAINPDTSDFSDYGVSKVSSEEFEKIYQAWFDTAEFSTDKRPRSLSYQNIENILSSDREIKHTTTEHGILTQYVDAPSMTEFLKNGKEIIDRILKYGASNSIDFLNIIRGTTWNSFRNDGKCDPENNEFYFQFECAWNPPYGVIEKLSEWYPEVEFNVSWWQEGDIQAAMEGEDITNSFTVKNTKLLEKSWEDVDKSAPNYWRNTLDKNIDEWIEHTTTKLH